jgi:hypothetical protein
MAEEKIETVENPCWEQISEPVGIRSRDPIYCPICKAREPSIKVEMKMRRSRIHTVADIRIMNPTDGNRPYAMDVAYKCPRCDYYCVFGVPVDIKHAHKILELRQGKVDFVLPEEVWHQDAQITKKFERWGYW